MTGSLRRLRTDHLDLLYAHLDDPTVALDETLGVFGELVDEGLVREIGASNLTAERLQNALSVPARHPYRTLQQRFTYLPNRARGDHRPAGRAGPLDRGRRCVRRRHPRRVLAAPLWRLHAHRPTAAG
nr:aldo/keto reductase [Lapillicoccus sp.]